MMGRDIKKAARIAAQTFIRQGLAKHPIHKLTGPYQAYIARQGLSHYRYEKARLAGREVA